MVGRLAGEEGEGVADRGEPACDSGFLLGLVLPIIEMRDIRLFSDLVVSGGLGNEDSFSQCNGLDNAKENEWDRGGQETEHLD